MSFDPVSYLMGKQAGGGGGGGVTVEPLSVTANGEYNAPSGKAYSPVTVAVEHGLDENSGEIAIATDTSTISFQHGLQDIPTIIVVHTPDPTVPGEPSPSTFRSIIAGCFKAIDAEEHMSGGDGYNTAGTEIALPANYFDFQLTGSTVEITCSHAGYKFKAGRTYKWRAII